MTDAPQPPRRLATHTNTATGAAPAEDAGWLRAAGQAQALSSVSLVWMTAEGILGLIAGIGAGSLSLVG